MKTCRTTHATSKIDSKAIIIFINAESGVELSNI